MKRTLATLAGALLVCSAMMGVPAKRGTVSVAQPDGSSLLIALHGDEWQHHTTTADGYTIVRNAQGAFVYATLDNDKLTASSVVAHNAAERTATERQLLGTIGKHLQEPIAAATLSTKQKVQARQKQQLAARQAGEYDYGKFRGLVILVEFNDMTFSRSDYKDVISDMINTPGYTGYRETSGKWVSCTGSVRDYYSDNSAGLFQPDFDVYGPYKINYSQYDARGGNNAAVLIKAVLDKADSEIDFSRYDGDGDGTVDMVYFLFAGFGANFQGNDSRLWWPHRSYIYDPYSYNYVRKDGKYLLDYASSTELYGYTDAPSTITLDGIGTICHEFSHVLGLPDFYDTDDNGSGGLSADPGDWSLMSSGCYLNKSRTPVGYSLYERSSLGFADVTTINKEGSYELGELGTTNTGYRIDTQQANEYFLLENRQPSLNKWDSALPGGGMLVFRVDKTSNSVWTNNTVNDNPSHNYYELRRADGLAHYDGTGLATVYDPFPGQARVTELHNTTSPTNLLSWAGKATQWGLSGISERDGVVTFDVGNSFQVTSISLPAAETLNLGSSMTLVPEIAPTFATRNLTWKSSNTSVATVDSDGKVTGIAIGQATITVTTDNNLKASCVVSVAEAASYPIGDFVAQRQETEQILQLSNAEVLYVYNDRAYVRDQSGSIIINGVGESMSKDDVVSGSFIALNTTSNLMPMATTKDVAALSSALTKGESHEAQPIELTADKLSADLYSNLVTVKGASLERQSGVWISEGEKRVRLFNPFQVKGLQIPTNVAGKYFDITGIFGTNVLNGSVIEELYLLSSPTETVAPTGISTVKASAKAAQRIYTLSGQYVGTSLQALPKGVYVVDSRKIVR